MTALRLFLTISSLALRSAPPAGRAVDSATTAYDVSGVRVIHRRITTNDIVAVRLYLLGGCRQVDERTAGIEPLLLEASAGGTAQFPGREATRAMARTGSLITLDPEPDWTVFGFTGLAEQLNQAWTVLADRLMAPTLTDEALTRARSRLRAMAHERYTDPDERVMMLALRGLFRDHPYALDPGGTEASLSALTVDDLKAYARDQLVTSRMLLVVVGNATRAQVDSLVAATLGQLPHGDYRWALPAVPKRRHARWLIENRPTATTYLLALFTGPAPTSTDYWSFRVATELLSSELYRSIRAERSLSYAAYAPFLDRAVPVGGAFVSTPHPDAVVPLMVKQIELLESRRLDPYGLDQFVKNFEVDYAVDHATAANQADFLARSELLLGGYRSGDDGMKRLRGVTPDAVAHVAAEFMTAVQYAYLGDTTRMNGEW